MLKCVPEPIKGLAVIAFGPLWEIAVDKVCEIRLPLIGVVWMMKFTGPKYMFEQASPLPVGAIFVNSLTQSVAISNGYVGMHHDAQNYPHRGIFPHWGMQIESGIV